MKVKDFYEKLDALYASRDYKRALEYMLEVQIEAREENNRELLVAVGNEIGAMYRIGGDTRKALEEYQRVIELLGFLGMKETKNHATALINLANVYTAMGDFEASYRCGQEAIVILKKYEESRYEIASIRNNMSIALRELGRLEEARSMARDAIGIINTLPERAVERGTSYINLGQIEAKTGDLAGARETLSHGLGVLEKAGALQDFHYIVGVHALAEVDELEKHLHPALDGYKKARYLYEKTFGRNKYYDFLNQCIERVEIKLDEH